MLVSCPLVAEAGLLLPVHLILRVVTAWHFRALAVVVDARRMGFRLREGAEMFYLITVSMPIVVRIQPGVLWEPVLFHGHKHPGCELTALLYLHKKAKACSRLYHIPSFATWEITN
jgi:hypothetical protein